MNCQMIRVISSPSSSTTVPSTLILLTEFSSCSCGPAAGSRRGRASGGGQRGPSSEVGYVGLLRAHGLGRLAQTRLLALGQVALDDLPDAFAADLGLHTEVDALDAVLAVDPGTHRHHRAGVLHDGLGHAGGWRRRRVV